MIVDFILDFMESFVRAALGWMPEFVQGDSSGADGFQYWLLGNLSTYSDYMLDLLSFVNYFLPVDWFFFILPTVFGIMAAMGLIRFIWRLLPGFG